MQTNGLAISPEGLLEKHQVQLVINGGTWNVFDKGSGMPIVFLHNGGGTLWNWAYQLQHFSTQYRVIAPDLPGFGRSYRSSEPLILNTYVQGLSELLKILDCSKPILVGNCIGSSIALQFALHNPEKVTALALFNVCGGMPMLNPRLQFWAALRPSTVLGKAFHQYMINAMSHPDLQYLNTRLIYADSEPNLHPMLSQFIEQQRLDPKLRASLYWLVMGLDSFNIFSQPQQKPAHFSPVLLGWGAQNRTLATRWAKVIAEWLTPDQFWLIENAGHMPMYEQPELVNEMLEVFFKQRQ
jgi:4,5:9,10-diseco-3-hydroxy-5,9,17-trioxoandrosta-1(10),2-diene-4-oate hydrolase